MGRNKDERDVLFKNLVQSLILHGSIQTSEAKAKAIKGLIDKIINLAKSKTSQRLLQAYLINESLRERLIKEILPKLENRVSGYTSLIRLGRRLGDNTMVVKMSLIGAESLKPLEKVTGDKKQVIKKVETKKKIQKNLKLKSQRSTVQVKSKNYVYKQIIS